MAFLFQPVSNELSSSNSGQETSSSAESPPPQQDFDVEMEAPKTDPAKWSACCHVFHLV